MKSAAILSAATRSLARAPTRSALTALGVIVGVAAVIATTSIGNGARTTLAKTLARPESRTIYLAAMPPPSRQRLWSNELRPADRLRATDYYAIRDEAREISAISPRIYLTNANVQSNGRALEVLVEGVDVQGFETVPRKLLEGALFNEGEVRRASNVCVISSSLATQLYPEGRPVNRPIRINHTRFNVVGVVDDDVRGTRSAFTPADMHVYVPFTSLLRRLDPTAQITISVQAADIERVSVVQQNVSDVVEQHRSGRKTTFVTSNAVDSIKLYADGSITVARLLAAVGAISLVVGGIGIMNIMLVSVKERTREIGIRMAAGTRCQDILHQFLAEAIVLSLLGGGVGIACGWIVSWSITRLNDWPTSVTRMSIAVALLCSLSVGIFFGYHPARRAALLQPVEALRAEG